MKHPLTVEYKVKVPGSNFTADGWYWSAWNNRNGHAEGGPYDTEYEAAYDARGWERDEFE